MLSVAALERGRPAMAARACVVWSLDGPQLLRFRDRIAAKCLKTWLGDQGSNLGPSDPEIDYTWFATLRQPTLCYSNWLTDLRFSKSSLSPSTSGYARIPLHLLP